jgi:hypothetical protein
MVAQARRITEIQRVVPYVRVGLPRHRDCRIATHELGGGWVVIACPQVVYRQGLLN